MERHAVPQNIMDVEFKLFGALTVKQFGYLAVGFIGAAIIFTSGLPFLIRIMFMFISIVLGLFLSLVRVNGQPSSVFLSNFVTALFSSQERIWRKKAITPDVLKNDPAQNDQIDNHVISRARKTQLNFSKSVYMPLENLQSATKISLDKYDQEEAQRLAQIDKHFEFEVDRVNRGGPKVVREEVVPPNIPVVMPPISNNPNAANSPIPVQPVMNTSTNNLASEVRINPESQFVVQSGDSQATVINSIPKNINRPFVSVAVSQPAQELTEEDRLKAEIALLQSKLQSIKTIEPEDQSQVEVHRAEEEEAKSESESLAVNVLPNILRGIVVTNDQRRISDANISIKNNTGQIVRKLLANKKGLFILQTPLPNGKYFVDIEAEGFKFKRYQVIFDGSVLPVYKFNAK